jgi:hypothetical protein
VDKSIQAIKAPVILCFQSTHRITHSERAPLALTYRRLSIATPRKNVRLEPSHSTMLVESTKATLGQTYQAVRSLVLVPGPTKSKPSHLYLLNVQRGHRKLREIQIYQVLVGVSYYTTPSADSGRPSTWTCKGQSGFSRPMVALQLAKSNNPRRRHWETTERWWHGIGRHGSPCI